MAISITPISVTHLPCVACFVEVKKALTHLVLGCLSNPASHNNLCERSFPRSILHAHTDGGDKLKEKLKYKSGETYLIAD